MHPNEIRITDEAVFSTMASISEVLSPKHLEALKEQKRRQIAWFSV
jgi:hypothetical protein